MTSQMKTPSQRLVVRSAEVAILPTNSLVGWSFCPCKFEKRISSKCAVLFPALCYLPYVGKELDQGTAQDIGGGHSGVHSGK